MPTTLTYRLDDEPIPTKCPICGTDFSTEDSIYVPVKLFAKRDDKRNLLITIPDSFDNDIVSTEVECEKCGEYI